MNHFEYGFLDELEKIATNSRDVASFKRVFEAAAPNSPKWMRGQAATGLAQYGPDLEGRARPNIGPLARARIRRARKKRLENFGSEVGMNKLFRS